MNIFVGNLSYNTTEDMLRKVFEAHGAVTAVRVIKDRETGKSRGFGFVEMANDEEARKAIAAADGQDCDGRPLRVNEAKPKEDRGAGGGGFGGGSGGRGGGGFRRGGGRPSME
jgi:RNA recognition motif-containing protein